MQLKVDVADVRPDTDAPKQQKVNSARAHMPAGTRAAARIDALMGADSPERAAERKNFTPPPPSFGYDFDAEDDVPTTGDKVRIIGGANRGRGRDRGRGRGGGLLTVQTGRAMLKCRWKAWSLRRKSAAVRAESAAGVVRAKRRKRAADSPRPPRTSGRRRRLQAPNDPRAT